jgi:hypothetical protein
MDGNPQVIALQISYRAQAASAAAQLSSGAGTRPFPTRRFAPRLSADATASRPLQFAPSGTPSVTAAGAPRRSRGT